MWQFRSDGTVDVRISKERYDALVPSPECTLLISDVEEYVRQAENVTTAPAAEWFEEYVSLSCACNDAELLIFVRLTA